MTKLEHLVSIVKHDMDNAGIPYNNEIPVIANNRLKTVAGKCFYRRSGNVRHAIRIEINGKMLKNESDEFLKNTICHELLHSAVECVSCGHKGQWKYYARLMSTRNVNYDITRCYESDSLSCSYRSEYKYKITCPVCGKTYFYRRKTKAVQYIMAGKNYYRCGRCNNDVLEAVEL